MKLKNKELVLNSTKRVARGLFQSFVHIFEDSALVLRPAACPRDVGATEGIDAATSNKPRV